VAQPRGSSSGSSGSAPDGLHTASAFRTTPTAQRRHAAPLRGLGATPSSPTFEGRFGRMFRNLPTFDASDAELEALAAQMLQEAEDDKDPTEPDDDENLEIPAGYTYLGQFIDHDITFDPVSSLQKQNDPDALVDFRTPRLDLDNLYGRGPDDQPYMYVDGGGEIVTGASVSADPELSGPDLPRSRSGRALIGDPRNDENLIVSQLQSVFIAFHNRMLERVRTTMPELKAFEWFREAQRLVRWHYQWVVLHDFLPRVLGGKNVKDGARMLREILREERYVAGLDAHGKEIHGTVVRPQLLFYHWKRSPFIPVEFSAAAYRFGHSMVRPRYFFNDRVRNAETAFGRTPIFSDGSTSPNPELANLNGFRALPAEWGFQWKYFFELDESAPEGFALPQPSYKMDTTLVNPLGDLRAPKVVNDAPYALAERNLKRGRALALPSGQVVAAAMGIAPLKRRELGLDGLPALVEHTPLWYYILREAEVLGDAHHLGPVGGRIVAEVFVGLLWGDPLSYLQVAPGWRPEPDLADRHGTFGMPQLIRFARGA
jgi:Animal haem peroxidase